MRSRRPELPSPPRNDRPSDTWVCGHSGKGCPCPSGPTPDGECQGAAGGCNPIGTAPKIRCGRPACLGGPCEAGPQADGSCGLVAVPCHPVRSLAARWSRATWIVGISAAALLLLLAMLPIGTEFFAPGPLSDGHRQILGTKLATERCAACHPGANGSLGQWLLPNDESHQSTTQTELCLNCHHRLVPPAESRSPHGLDKSKLSEIANQLSLISGGDRPWLAKLEGNDQQLECAACHREHHGSTVTFTSMSDAQCQVCHQQPFASFTVGHPDWHQWPYGRGGEVRFNHQSHQLKHHPSKQAVWNCQDCHQRTEQGELKRSVSYEAACASCHDGSLKQQSAEGFVLFQVPSIDIDSLNVPSDEVPVWPENASGLTDLSLPPVMQLLLAADGFDATMNGDHESPKRVIELMNSVNRLADEIRAEGSVAIAKRIESLAGISPQSQDLVKTLPLQIIEKTNWWPGIWQATPVEKSATKEPLIKRTMLLTENNDSQFGELLADDPDPLALDPLALNSSSEVSGANAKEPMINSFGWMRDDRVLAVRYRASGHADPQLRLLAELAMSQKNEELQPIGAAIESLPSIKACFECHRPNERDGQITWRANGMELRPRGFTKFSHRPHLHQPHLQDCTHCHKVNPAHVEATTLALEKNDEFLPMERTSCVDCHRKNSANTSCTQCHQYHVESFTPIK